MTKEFNLSEKSINPHDNVGDMLYYEDVKEKIQETKERLKKINFGKKDFRILNDINKIFLEEFGEDLI